MPVNILDPPMQALLICATKYKVSTHDVNRSLARALKVNNSVLINLMTMCIIIPRSRVIKVVL